MKEKSAKDVLSTTNGQIIIGSAHRYALGRKTYVTESTIEWLKENWDFVEDNIRFVILKDTAHAIMEKNAGMTMDEELWLGFLRWGIKESGGIELEYDLRKSLLYVRADWPLDYCQGCGVVIHNCLCSHDDVGNSHDYTSDVGNSHD